MYLPLKAVGVIAKFTNFKKQTVQPDMMPPSPIPTTSCYVLQKAIDFAEADARLNGETLHLKVHKQLTPSEVVHMLLPVQMHIAWMIFG